ncbi:MAG: nuclear transport factor 2 family protein [Actinomycetota bacterium]
MSNADTARAAYEAFAGGDMDALHEMFAEDAEWLTSDELPLGGLVRGRDAIMENFTRIPDYWSQFSVEPEEFIDCGDDVVVKGTQRATGEGGSFEAPFLHLMRFRDGKLARGEFYSDSAQAVKALGSKAAAV